MKRLVAPYGNLLDELIDCLLKAWNGNLVSVVVFGSVARGVPRADSDIDLLVVCKEFPLGRLGRQSLFMEVERLLNLEPLYSKGYYPSFSPILKTVEEARRLSPVYLDMVDDAFVLYDVGGFFKSVLDKLREALRKLGARRVVVGSRWYWDLKPEFKYGDEIVIE
jgi:predicted nucleotidyltransferase